MVVGVILPLDFDAPIVENGLFIGSTVRLLEELARIRAMSAIDIAVVPSGYSAMRAGNINWSNGEDEPLSDDDVLRWLWNAL